MTSSKHVYEVRPRKDKRGVDLISDVLPIGRLCRTQSAMQPATQGFQPLTRCCNSRLRWDGQRD